MAGPTKKPGARERLFTARGDLTDVAVDATVDAAATPAPDARGAKVALTRSRDWVERVLAEITPDNRYEDIGLLGIGGMGEVRLVRDTRLGRTVAMKLLKSELLEKRGFVGRFLDEAQASAQLQHPGIVPVHELGRLADGRLYLIMREIRGETLSEAIDEVHFALEAGQAASDSGRSLFSLLTAFARVCEAMAYAHGRGVIHRDLKPDNIMLGDNGEVLVVDWGLAKITGRTEASAEGVFAEPVVTERSESGVALTQFGAVPGTPAFVPPERVLGMDQEGDPRTDVYALGAILYVILSGMRPYRGRDVHETIVQVSLGPPTSLRDLELSERLPDELVEVCERAMAREPEDRYPNAAALAADVQAWLDGRKRRSRALAMVESALSLDREAAEQLREAAALREAARVALDGIPAWADESEKAAGWAQEDRAEALDNDARVKEIEAEQTLQSALTHMPELVEAHDALAARYLDQHRAAESARDAEAATRAELRLRQHVGHLPLGSPAFERYTAYLQGEGLLSLVTDPPGAEVVLHRYALQNRRLEPGLPRSLGQTPFSELSLPTGSYLLILRKEGHHEVRYPVLIEREQHWNGVRPGASEPTPVVLPLLGAVGDDELYVPGGWFVSGGDPQTNGFERTWLWVDNFCIRRFPIVNEEYIAFLEDLIATGREEEALRHVPRERAPTDELGAMIYGREGDRFYLRPDADGDQFGPRWAAMQLDWFGAVAYGEWWAAQTGQAWRLPHEFEWEKAARGVDGRLYPWGDFFDPSWACSFQSHREQVLPKPIETYPLDISPYGVRGMAGHMQDWCANVDAGRLPEDRLVRLASTAGVPYDSQDGRVYRGGTWSFYGNYARLARRYYYPPASRFSTVGFRLARSLA